jgi:hypothetical protein
MEPNHKSEIMEYFSTIFTLVENKSVVKKQIFLMFIGELFSCLSSVITPYSGIHMYGSISTQSLDTLELDELWLDFVSKYFTNGQIHSNGKIIQMYPLFERIKKYLFRTRRYDEDLKENFLDLPNSNDFIPIHISFMNLTLRQLQIESVGIHLKDNELKEKIEQFFVDKNKKWRDELRNEEGKRVDQGDLIPLSFLHANSIITGFSKNLETIHMEMYNDFYDIFNNYSNKPISKQLHNFLQPEAP